LREVIDIESIWLRIFVDNLLITISAYSTSNTQKLSVSNSSG